jgi:hypothetical protein
MAPTKGSDCDVRVPKGDNPRAIPGEMRQSSTRLTLAEAGRIVGRDLTSTGHSRSTLVDLVYAHSMQSGMASVAENVTARALGVKPNLRVIEGGKAADARQPRKSDC